MDSMNKLNEYFAHYQHLTQKVVSLQTYKNRTDILLKEQDNEINDYKQKIHSLNSEIGNLKAECELRQTQLDERDEAKKEAFEKIESIMQFCAGLNEYIEQLELRFKRYEEETEYFKQDRVTKMNLIDDLKTQVINIRDSYTQSMDCLRAETAHDYEQLLIQKSASDLKASEYENKAKRLEEEIELNKATINSKSNDLDTTLARLIESELQTDIAKEKVHKCEQDIEKLLRQLNESNTLNENLMSENTLFKDEISSLKTTLSQKTHQIEQQNEVILQKEYQMNEIKDKFKEYELNYCKIIEDNQTIMNELSYEVKTLTNERFSLTIDNESLRALNESLKNDLSNTKDRLICIEQESKKKLDLNSEHLKLSNDQVAIHMSRLETLEHEKNELTADCELLKNQIKLLQEENTMNKTICNQQVDEIVSLTLYSRMADERVQALESQINQIMLENKLITENLNTQLSKTNFSLEQKQHDIDELNSELTKLIHEVESKQKQLDEVTSDWQHAIETTFIKDQELQELQFKAQEADKKLVVSIDDFQKRMQSMGDQLKDVQKELENSNKQSKKKKDTHEKIKAKDTELKELKSQLKEKNVELNALKKKCNQLEIELNEKKKMIEQLNNVSNKQTNYNDASLEQVAKELSEKNHILHENTTKIQDLEEKCKQFDELSKKLSTSETEVNTLKAEINTQKNQLIVCNKHIDDLNTKLTKSKDLSEKLKLKESEIKELKKSKDKELDIIKTLNDELNQKVSELQEFKAKYAEKGATIHELNEKIDKIKEYENILESKTLEIDELKTNLHIASELETKLKALNDENSKLKESLSKRMAELKENENVMNEYIKKMNTLKDYKESVKKYESEIRDLKTNLEDKERLVRDLNAKLNVNTKVLTQNNLNKQMVLKHEQNEPTRRKRNLPSLQAKCEMDDTLYDSFFDEPVFNPTTSTPNVNKKTESLLLDISSIGAHKKQKLAAPHVVPLKLKKGPIHNR